MEDELEFRLLPLVVVKDASRGCDAPRGENIGSPRKWCWPSTIVSPSEEDWMIDSRYWP